tara:strand:+ start:11342 stop:12985 length:1644 start_codon:yes stop_codon:yes gene_type:complete
MNAKDLIKMYNREKGSSERANFNDIYESCASFCNPKADDIQSQKAKGERTDVQRVIDIGIKARRLFTAGMMSHLFPQGQNWIRVVTVDRELMDSDNVKRALVSVTKKFMSVIENSNFYEEMGQCIDQCGYIGTTTLYCEPDKRNKVNWRSHYINQFYFCENYQGIVDTVIREFKLTARQVLQQFQENCPESIKEQAINPSTSTKEYKFIHVVMPRTDYKIDSNVKSEKKIASYYVSLTTSEIILESGFDEMPYSVGRFYKTNFEKYGRSPASEVINTLPMINRFEVSRIRGAERVSNPPWLAPNDGSVRKISNDQGSIIYYNAGNPLSKPEQLRPMDNVIVNDDMIKKKEQEVLDAFYVPLFNPLQDRQNMTAFESRERLNLSLQFLTPAVNRLNKYFVKPSLERAFGIMLREGNFPELEIEELSGASIDFDLVGKASIAARQIELFGTMTAIQQMSQVAQLKPEIFDNVNVDRLARFMQEVNMMPIDLQATEEEVATIRQRRLQQQLLMREMQQTQVVADAYQKTGKMPEEGSPAEDIQREIQEGQ